MKIIGLLISLLLHAGLIILAVSWKISPPVKISLDMPVYKVDLVSYAALPAAPAVKKAPLLKSELSKPGAVPVPAAKPKAVPDAKPEAVKAAPPKPLPQTAGKPKLKPAAKVISAKKIKTTAVHKQKEVEKPVKAEVPVKKKPEKKKVVQKAVPRKSDVSEADSIAADLAAIAKTVQSKKRAEKSAVAHDLAALSRTAAKTEIGGSADGTVGASGLVQIYASIVKEEVRKNWRYPVFGQKDNLVARVRIELKSSGEISSVKLLDSSGNADFDDSVLTALRDTEVLPKPPGTSIRNIVVNFNLHDLDQ